MMKAWLCAAGLLFVSVACIRKPHTTGSALRSIAWPENLQSCPGGFEYTPFQLQGGRPSHLTPTFAVGAGDPFVEASLDANLRLDICTGFDGTLKLRQVVHFRKGGRPELDAMSIDEGALVEGLEALLFEQDASKLVIRPGGDMPFGYVILGGKEDGRSFVAAGKGMLDGSTWKALSDSAWVMGTIAAGDPFSTMECPASYAPRDESFSIGSASFEIRMCLQTTSVGQSDYSFLKLSLTDSNPALPTASPNTADLLRGVRKDFSKEELASLLTYTVTHHNEEDTWQLTLPNAAYRRNKQVSRNVWNLAARYGDTWKEWTEPLARQR